MLTAIVVCLLNAGPTTAALAADGGVNDLVYRRGMEAERAGLAAAGSADAGSVPPGKSAPKPAAGPPPAVPPTGKAPAAKPMTPEVKSLVERMQAFYEKTQDFTANFTQAYKYKLQRRTATSSGTVIFKKPALMRWDYLKPAPKTFVLSGEKVFAYDPAALTLTKGVIGQDQLSASVTFLWGKGKLADEFAITEAACDHCAGKMLELTPLRQDPRFRRVKFEVDPKTAQVLRSVVVDQDGSENEIRFADLKTNTQVAKERFELNPPADVQIVDLAAMQPKK